MMLGRMICLIGMEIQVIAWRGIRWQLDWERRTRIDGIWVDGRRSARLKVENLHFDLSEEDLSVYNLKERADNRIYLEGLVLLRVYG
jgi:hypothetical protein